MKYLNTVMERFGKHWRNEYLLELREGHRHKGTVGHSTIAVGNVVIVQGEDTLCGFWKLARLEEIIVGQDGLVKGVVVRVGNSSTLWRPLQRL